MRYTRERIDESKIKSMHDAARHLGCPIEEIEDDFDDRYVDYDTICECECECDCASYDDDDPDDFDNDEYDYD